MSRKKKIWRTVLIIFGALILILASVGWYLLSRWEKIVKNQLEDYAQKITNGLYHAEVKDVQIHLINGSLHVKGLSLYPDSTKLEYLRSVDSIPATYGKVYIEDFRLNGVNFQRKKDREGRSLSFSEISIKGPDIVITRDSRGITPPSQDTLIVKKDPSSDYTSPLYKIISPVFDKIGVAEISLSNGKVTFNMESASDTAVFLLDSISFHAERFLVDSTAYDQKKAFYCDDLHFSIGNTHHILPGKSYGVEVGKIMIGVSDSIFSIDHFKLIPQFPKTEFAYKTPKHSDWMELSVGTVKLKGFDFRKLVLEKTVNIDSLIVQNVNFGNYKNQKIVIEHHKMPLIYEPFQRIKVPIRISNGLIDNFNLVYEELPKKGNKAGLISFTNMRGEFSGWTNIPDSLNHTNKLIAKAKLMNEGQVNATIFFPVDSMNDRFEIVGTLGPMKMATLNRIIEPLSPARIKSGYIRGMDYYIVGGRYKAFINMQLLYNDLTADILKGDGNQERSSNQVASFLANGLIKRDNPDKGDNKEPRRVTAEHIRDPYHSSFNYLWKIYLSGLVQTVGFTKERQDNMKWFKNAIDKIKGGSKKKETKKK